MTPARLKRVLALALALVVIAPAAALAAPPDPLARGPYTVTTVDPVLMGPADLQEPNAAGGPLTAWPERIVLNDREPDTAVSVRNPATRHPVPTCDRSR